MTSQLVWFTFLLITFIYVVNSILAKKFKKIDLRLALLYISSVAMMGVFGEVFVGSIYTHFVGSHLWNYTVYPVHGGFTSYYAPVLWGAYGFWLYLFHGTLTRHGVKKVHHLAVVTGLETIFLEAIINGGYKALYGNYLFYYLPGDLWHLTSIRALPFYFIAGLVIVKLIRHTKPGARFYIVINIYLIFVLVWLAK